MSSNRTILPFPDLTGLRSSAHDRRIKQGHVHAEARLSITHAALYQAARSVASNLNAEDLLAGAYLVVLTHLLSPEDDCSACVCVSGHTKQTESTAYISCDSTRASRGSQQLKPFLRSLKLHSKTSAGTTDNAIVFSGPSLCSGQAADLRAALVTLTVQAGLPGDHIALSLRASMRIHSQGSAKLHLQQIATCIESFTAEASGRSPSQNVFSLQRYPSELRAGDNPLPKQHPTSNTAERERFEHQFERVARQKPDGIALEFRSTLNGSSGHLCFTYAEVDRIANAIAEAIMHLPGGLRQTKGGHRIVALCLEKSHWTYLAILGVLKAGAAWCPIDTDWPIARRKALLEKSEAECVLAAGPEVIASLQHIRSSNVNVICLDQIDLARRPRAAPPVKHALPNELAYLIWTSGTTGLPKAVGIPHSAAVQALRSLQDVIPHDGQHIRYLQFSAYNFDLMILDMFYTLGLGGTLCSSTRPILLTNLIEIANEFEATHTLLTPAVMAMTPRESIPSLQVVINGGEKLSQTVADMWSVRCCLLNLYGPAEATLIAMHRRVPQNDTVKAPNIGRALATTSCHAVDAEDRIVLKGSVGQLVLGGHQCAVGYVGDADKTADKFVQHPELDRVYKTGDMVRQLWNGNFEYLGRSDDQVKINGIRIELLEINATIRAALECVKDSETLLIPLQDTRDDGVHIVNFSIIPTSNEQTSLIRIDEEAVHLAGRLIERVRATLPSYMVPSLFMILRSFPKTSSAKIDREALKAALLQIDIVEWQNRVASVGQDDSDDGGVDEEVEDTLRQHISVASRIDEDQIGRHTSLPQLGIDSIQAISLAKRLNGDGILLSAVDIVTHDTLAKLAKRIRMTAAAENSHARRGGDVLARFDTAVRPSLAEKVTANNISKVLPATPLQEALLSETMQNAARYWLHRVYFIPSGVEEQALRRAVATATECIEVLRTAFVSRTAIGVTGLHPAGNSVQVVLSHHTPDVRVCEIVDVADEELARRTAKVHSLDVTAPTPAVAFTIVEVPRRLVMHIHHALYDLTSILAIEEAIQDALSGRERRSYSPFSVAVPHLLALDEKEEEQQENRWRNLLSNVPRPALAAPPKLKMAISTPSSVNVSLDVFRRTTAIALDDIKQCAQRLSSSIRPMLQGALTLILSRLCDSQDIMLGDSISLRALSSHLQGVVGPVLATMAVPVHIDESTTFRALCGTLAAYHRDALPHAHVSVGRIRRMLEVPRRSEMFHALFLFEPPSEDVANKPAEVGMLQHKGDFGIAVEHTMAVEVSVGNTGKLAITLNVKHGYADRAMASVFLAQYEAAIAQLMRSPDQRCSAVRLEGEVVAKSHFAVPEIVRKASERPAYQAFQEHACAHPDAQAIEFHSSLPRDEEMPMHVARMTYRELDEQSTKLALFLADKVPQRSVVGVTMTRSMETYVALLAILKAGCTYLPIDVSLPIKRRRTMLQIGNAASVLVRQESIKTYQDVDVVVVDVDAVLRSPPLHSAAVPMPKVRADDAAYILFTSGSTGTPKGCVLSHRNLGATLSCFRIVYDQHAPGSLVSGVRFLARSVEAFDVSLLEAMFPLVVGGTIVTAPRHVLLADLGKAMQALQVTHAAVVPSLLFIDNNRRRVLPKDVPHMRALIVGGERIPRDVIDAWSDSSVPLLNAYGPSEACIGTSIARMRPGDATGNVGVAFASTQYVVLRSNAELHCTAALRGETGELAIAGLQVGAYLSGSDNESAFVECDGQRVYRTGDEVRMWADDSVEILGRMGGDTQVKVRGVRIELGEIDFALGGGQVHTVTRLLSHPELASEQIVTFAATSVSNALTMVRLVEDEALAHDVVADLYAQAKARLPSYMVPRLIVPLMCLPIASISGKYDARMLSDWLKGQSLSELQALHRTNGTKDPLPLTAMEQVVCDEVKRLFNVQRDLNASSDLFAAGLDSLSIVALAGALSMRNLHVDVAAMMADGTLGGIAAIAATDSPTERLSGGDEWHELSASIKSRALYKHTAERTLPCLPLQAAVVAKTMMEAQQQEDKLADGVYINVMRITVNAKNDQVKASTLREAIHTALSRHAIYRTCFCDLDDGSIGIAQVVLRHVDFASLELYSSDVTSDWGRRARREIALGISSVPPLRYRIAATHLDLAVHHALYDGHSLSALLDEIARYVADGATPALRPATSFADVVERIAAVSEADRLAYWTDRLRDFTVDPFPCLTGRKATDARTDIQTAELDSAVPLSMLGRTANKLKATLAVLTLDAFAWLYGQYIGTDDVTIGLVLSGRMSPADRDIHGPCVNSVPFRVKDVRQTDALQRLQHIRTAYGDAIKYQHVPLIKLNNALRTGGNGLFNVLFSFLGESMPANGVLSEVTSDMQTEYPLALEIETDAKSDTLRMRIVYNAGFLPDEHARILLQQLDQRLSGSIDADNLYVNNHLLALENVDAHRLKVHHFLELFKRQTTQRPHATAIYFTDDMETVARRSYAELDGSSDRIANALQHLSASPGGGGVVGVHMAQCADIYPLLIGIWKAGRTYLPLDTKLPVERLRYIVSMAEPSVIITTNDDRSAACELAGTFAGVMSLEQLCKDRQHAATSPSLDLDHAAYIMFTSGSSGNPKGVQVSHRALGAALLSWQRILPHTPGQSRMLQLASPGFDVFMIEVCMPLAMGFALASAPKEVLLDDLEKTFRTLQLTIADLPAALATTVTPDRLPPLEWLMSGGDQMDQRVLDAWSKHNLINAWGPTEATIGNTLGFVRTNDASRSWIGFAYPTSTLAVLQSDGTDVALRGCVGELAVGGPQLADGYIKRQELTADKFVEVALGRDKTMRLYRTGDRGRILHDGSVECLGRIAGDGQVKINSQRVELKEIEVALCHCDDVKDAAVMYLQHPQLASKQLVAFLIVDQTSSSASPTDLQLEESADAVRVAAASLAAVSTHLASYMVPQHCLVLRNTVLPLTPNNKIDLRRIKEFYARLSDEQIRASHAETAHDGHSAPWSKEEEKLRMIVAELAGVAVDSIRRHTSLHSLGIDSLSGFRLARRLREAGVQGITARAILRSPTISSLAASIVQGKVVPTQAPLFHVTQSESDAWRLCSEDRIAKTLPCTPLQEGMILETLASDGRLYVHHHAYLFDARHVDAIVGAFRTLVQRHEILRTSFHVVEGGIVQAVHSKAEARIVILRKGESKTVRDTVIKIQSNEGFATEQSMAQPPVKMFVVRHQCRAALNLVIHHALYDAESLDMLFQQLEQMVMQTKANDEPDVQFSSVALALVSSPSACAYWADALVAHQDCLLAPQSSTHGQSRIKEHSMRISAKQVTAFAAEVGVTMHCVMQFAFAKLLAHLTGQRSVVFGQLFSLRDITEGAERVMGPCLNTVLTPISIGLNESAKAILRRLQQDTDDGREHRNASLALVQKELTIRRGRPAAFDTLFDLQRSGDLKRAATYEGLLEPLQVGNGDDQAAVHYVLNMQVAQVGDQLSLTCTARSENVSEDALARWLALYEAIVAQLITFPDGPAHAMPSGVAALDAMPSGIAKAAVQGTREAQAGSGMPATTATQVTIAHSIAGILATEASQMDCSIPLSHYGIDSIVAIRLASALRKQGHSVGVADVLQGKTIDGIARRLDVRRERPPQYGSKTDDDDGERAAVAKHLDVDIAHIEAVLDLLPGQHFWCAQATNVFTFFYRVDRTKVDFKRLQDAWTALRKRHAILRTTFLSSHSSQKQVIWTAEHADADIDNVRWSHHSHKSLSDFVKDTAASLRWVEEQIDVGRNLALRPPCACHVVSNADDTEPVLVLRLHHALYDAVSLAMLVRDLARLYEQSAEHLSEPMSYLRYARFVAQERRDRLEEAKAYWTRLFAGKGEPTPLDCTGEGSTEFFVFVRNGIRRVSAKEDALQKGGTRTTGLRLPAVIMAAWAHVLAQLESTGTSSSHSQTISFCAYQHGRSAAFPEVESVVGNLLNILPVEVQIDCKGGDDVLARDLQRTATAIQAQMQEHSHLDYFTRLDDVAQWAASDGAPPPWWTYVNLLWPSSAEETDEAFKTVFSPLTKFMTQDGVSNVDASEAARRATAASVYLDVRLDRDFDAVHFGVRWTTSRWGEGDVRSVLDSIARMVEATCCN